MLEKIKLLIKDQLRAIDIEVSDVLYVKENGTNVLRIVLDSLVTLDLKKIVEATKIINSIIDKENIIKETYVLDVCSKEKEGI